MISPWLGILIIVTALGAVMGLLALGRVHLGLSGEVSRKGVHVIMGLCCLSFPWIFHSVWPVLLLCALSLAALILLRFRKEKLHAVLHDVGRFSYGDLFFPVAVALLFVLMENPVTDYLVPVLVLTIADAVGALIGVRYGMSSYSTDEGYKSLEGSTAFFFAAFLSTHVPLLLLTDIGRTECLLIGVLVGILVMLLEAVAWRGLDNLFIPLGTYLLLQFYPLLNTPELTLRLIMLLGTILVLWMLRKWTYARDSTLIAAVLLYYLIWVVGGWSWLWPPIALLIGYCLLCPPAFREERSYHGLSDLGAVAGMGFAWLFLSVVFPQADLYWAYTFSWATQLSMIACAYLTWKKKGIEMGPAVAQSLIICGLLFLFPVFVHAKIQFSIIAFGVLLIACVLATSVYWKLEWIRRGGTNTPGRAWRQLTYGSIASCLGLTLMLLL